MLLLSLPSVCSRSSKGSDRKAGTSAASYSIIDHSDFDSGQHQVNSQPQQLGILLKNQCHTMTDAQIYLSYFICGPVFAVMLFVYFYYCYLNVRECQRSRGREFTTPSLDDNSEERVQVY
ncbi:uncharacterized protein LOC108087100 [Drosophila ficusphila]|uniref:uncharacterized protein LOC108087100 n=1 Tax=Drosophila ficusphila TaxID=30025 RepID=UPI0007E7A8D8|nr:uncharacterized protein LOC108087100 [Drosophila ficusphila]